jgi:dipeptidyl aminopeptidase/acylaminoacyl peptidase
VVLSLHGGPRAQERPILNPTYQALCASGIAVFAPNVRGSSGYGRAFAALDDGPLRRDAVSDVGAAAAWLVESELTMPGRLGTMGASYGGFLALSGLVDWPDLFGAGMVLAAITDFIAFFRDAEPWMASSSVSEYGDPVKDEQFLRALSPLPRTHRVTAPVLIIHGRNDTNVPLSQSTTLHAALRRQQTPTELLTFPDEGHGIHKLTNRTKVVTATVDWFTQHLTKQP